MIPTTKAGKECQSRMCLNGRDAMKESIPCQTCHGLGWLPAPGDALTSYEAEKMMEAGRTVQARYLQGDPNAWEDVNPRFATPYHSLFAFRLAPAPETLSVEWEAQAKAAASYIEALEWPAKFAQGKAPKSGYYEAFLKIEERRIAYRSTLTPAQLGALRKGRA